MASRAAETGNSYRPHNQTVHFVRTLAGSKNVGCPNVYVDLGYWNEVTGKSRPGTAVVNRVRKLVEQTPALADRIIYGSDYTMIGRESQHNAYLRDVAAAIDSIDALSGDAVFALNSQRYLGLNNPDSPTRQRLDAFFRQAIRTMSCSSLTLRVGFTPASPCPRSQFIPRARYCRMAFPSCS